jgi:hypothetical protein
VAENKGSIACDVCEVGRISTGKTCLEAPIDATLPTLQNVRVVVGSSNTTTNSPLNYSIAIIQWDAYIANDKPSRVASVFIQWSNNLEFPPSPLSGSRDVAVTNEGIRSTSGNVEITIQKQFSTLKASVLYVRVHTLHQDGKRGEWSTPSKKWLITNDCPETSYLNVSQGTLHSFDPATWQCSACPVGASCLGDITWEGVVALFGWWRVPGVAPNEFIACPWPGACLGAKNIKYEGKYLNATTTGTDDIDYAMHRLKEGCNEYFGFQPGSRLCHTCLDAFRRQGLDRCSKCPLEGQNYGLMSLAVLLLIVGGVAVVWMAIKDAGKADESEIIRKITFNFLQVAALAAGFPLHWPPALEALFDFQGAISTAGEHLLNPDCSVRGVDAASLFYAKQIGYALTPLGLSLVIFAIWKVYSLVAGIEWSNRVRVETHTPKDKMIVTICVLLYFFWPTSLKQTFQIFSCRSIGAGDHMYLMAE